MSYRLQRSESVTEGIKRIAREQLKKAEHEIQSGQTDRHETVHQVRKRFKKLRGLIRLVRPGFEKTYRRENARYRDIGGNLSTVRDAQSMIEAFERLVETPATTEESPFRCIHEFLLNRRTKIAGELTNLEADLAEMSCEIKKAKQRVKGWKVKGNGIDAILAGFEAIYARGQTATENAAKKNPAAEDFHEWRKNVKYHWYHCRLLEGLWKPIMKARSDQAKQLGEMLGEDHDLSILDLLIDEHKAELGPEAAEFCKLIQLSQQSIRQQALLLGQRLYAEKPKHLSRRLNSWWTTWRDVA